MCSQIHIHTLHSLIHTQTHNSCGPPCTHSLTDTQVCTHAHLSMYTPSPNPSHMEIPVSVHTCILILRHTLEVGTAASSLAETPTGPPRILLQEFFSNLAFLGDLLVTLESSPPRGLGTEGSSTAWHSQVAPPPLTHVKTSAQSELQAPHPFM